MLFGGFGVILGCSEVGLCLCLVAWLLLYGWWLDAYICWFWLRLLFSCFDYGFLVVVLVVWVWVVCGFCLIRLRMLTGFDMADSLVWWCFLCLCFEFGVMYLWLGFLRLLVRVYVWIWYLVV